MSTVRQTSWAARLILGAAMSSALLSSSASAQDRQPIVVVKLANYQRLWELATYAGKVVDDEKFGDKLNQVAAKLLNVEGFKIGELPGIDRSRPLGAAVLTEGSAAVVGLFVPITDLAHLIEGFKPLIGDTTADEQGVYQLTLAGQTTQLKAAGDWAIFTPDASLLSNPPDVVALLATVPGEHDLAIRIQMRNVPEANRDFVFNFVSGGGAAAALPGESEATFAFRRQTTEQFGGWARSVLTEADETVITWDLNDASGKIQGKMTVTPGEGTALAGRIGAQNSAPGALSTLVKDDDVFAVHVNMSLDSQLREDFLRHVDAYRAAVLESVRQASGDVDEASRATLEKLAGQFLNLMQGSVESGRLHGVVRLVGGAPPVSMLMAMQLAEGADLNAAVRELAQAATDDPGFTEVQLDSAEHAGAAIHAFSLAKPNDPKTGKPSRQKDTLDKVFSNRKLLVAQSGNRAFLALGPKASDVLKEAITVASTEPAADAARPPLYVTSRMGVAANVAGLASDNATLAPLLGLMGLNFSFGGDKQLDDRLTISLRPDGNKLVGDIEMGNGVFGVIGRIVPLVPTFLGGATGGGGGARGGGVF